jgi:hypothetical protein
MCDANKMFFLIVVMRFRAEIFCFMAGTRRERMLYSGLLVRFGVQFCGEVGV